MLLLERESLHILQRVAYPAISVGGRVAPPHAPLPKMWCPLDGSFKLYLNHCHRDPVNYFFYKNVKFIV